MSADSTLAVVLVYPRLLGTYGDRGNALVLLQRLRWRGIPAELVEVDPDAPVPARGDLYVLGGGEDVTTELAATRLHADGALGRAVADGATVLGVCAGMQLLGHGFADRDGHIRAGLALLDVTSDRRAARAVGEVLVEPDPVLALPTITGYENHRGATHLGPAARPLGRVRTGVGNGAPSAQVRGPVEGAVQGHILGTYLHGPVLARNPDLADLLLSWALGAPLGPLELPEVAALRQARLGGRPGGRPGRRLRISRTPRVCSATIRYGSS